MLPSSDEEGWRAGVVLTVPTPSAIELFRSL
jgi:hypothetical protein